MRFIGAHRCAPWWHPKLRIAGHPMDKKIIESLSQTQAGIALFDENERIVFANPAWEQLISGVAEEDLIFNETELSDGGMISICLVKPLALPAERPDKAQPDGKEAAGTVIIADDSESNRMVARRILQTEGYSVIEASNGQAVLNILKRGITVDMILMDVEMPDMDGLHTTRRIRHMAGRCRTFRSLPCLHIKRATGTSSPANRVLMNSSTNQSSVKN